MIAARKIHATVQAGGKIEIVAPDLPAGQSVDVIILPSNEAQAKRSAMDILANAPPHRLFKTAQNVDDYIREERDSWDR